MIKLFHTRTKYSQSGLKMIFLFIVALIQVSGFSQSTSDSLSTRTRPGFFAGFEAGVSNGSFILDGRGSMSEMMASMNNSFTGTFETGYFFSGGFGLSTGFGIYSFNNTISLENYLNNYETRDSEDDTYDRRISGSGIIENQKISYFKIPLILNLRIPRKSLFGLYFGAGINLSVPLTKEYSSKGLFTFTGYYPEFNVILKDLPEYGFISDAGLSTIGEIELRSFIVDATVSAGFQFLIANKVQLSLGAGYSRSLKDITEYSEEEPFQLASGTEEIRSMLGGSNSTLAESMGIRFSFRYFFKGYRIRSMPPRGQ
jgi:hypothetical protein